MIKDTKKVMSFNKSTEQCNIVSRKTAKSYSVECKKTLFMLLLLFCNCRIPVFK